MKLISRIQGIITGIIRHVPYYNVFKAYDCRFFPLC